MTRRGMFRRPEALMASAALFTAAATGAAELPRNIAVAAHDVGGAGLEDLPPGRPAPQAARSIAASQRRVSAARPIEAAARVLPSRR